MDQKKLMEIQTKRGAKAYSFETNVKTLETVISECRKKIEENSDRYKDLDPLSKKEVIKEIIVEYVMRTKPLVDGYIDDENRPDTLRLADKLVEDITNYGILTQAMLDERVYEIRCNGKEIKVEIEGRVVDLTDKDGNIISFETPEQQDIIMRKLLGDVRLTPKDAVVNGRTIEGYRVAAVHSSALSPDPNNPTAEKYHAFVLRKFKKSKMSLSDIVKKGTMSDGMAQFLSLAIAGGLTFVTCGPTASGKTTTNNAILQATPPTTRVVLLQNPSEIDLRFKDSTGRVYNDVLHLEAREIDNPRPQDPTMANLMAHILRLSPTFVCFGELRTNKEFALGMTILQAGHPVNATYHAEDSVGAVRRFLTAYMAETRETIETALPTLTDLLNVIVIQKIMRDGTRKVLQISEVLGVDPNNSSLPLINDLYIFEPQGEPEYDNNGRVVKIPGIHKRVGKLSDKTIRKFRIEGIKPSLYEYLTKDVSDDEVETYTGNIQYC
ncbi:MAG: ATPase, T2SS/T4P/T4SS family [Candidatus Anstonellales archaeon]